MSLKVARLTGDGVVADSEKPRERTKCLVEFQQTFQNHLNSRVWIEAVAPFANDEHWEQTISAFRWSVEFREVFKRENGGFHAIVGNPPFAGRNTITATYRQNYLPWLQTLLPNGTRALASRDILPRQLDRGGSVG